MLDEAAALAAMLRRYGQVESTLATATASADEIERVKLPAATAAHKAATEAAAQAHTALDAARFKARNESEALIALDEADTRRHLDESARRGALLQSAAQMTAQHSALEKEYSEATKAATEAEKTLAAATDALMAATALAAERERHSNDAHAAYDKAFNALGDHAAALRSVIAVGDTCPVCGNTVSRIPTGEELLESLRPVKEMAEKALNAFNEAKTDMERRRKQASDAEAASASARALEQRASKAVADARRNLDKCLTDAHTAGASLAADTAGNHALTERLKLAVAEIERRRKSEQEASQALTAAMRAASATDMAVQKAGSDIDVLRARARAIAENMAALTAEKNDIEVRVARSVSLDNALAAPADTARRIELMADERRTLTDRRDRLTARIEASTERLTVADSSLALAEAALPKLLKVKATDGENNNADILALSSRLHADSAATATVRSDIARAMADARRRLHSTDGGLSLGDLYRLASPEAREAAEEARKELTDTETRMREADMALRQARAEADRHAGERPDMPADCTAATWTERIARAAEIRAALLKEQGSIDSELRRDSESRTQRAEMIAEMERRKEEYTSWQVLDDNFGGAGGMRFSRLAQSHILASLLHNANYYLARFTPRYVMKSLPGALQVLIVDLYNGGDLRPFNTLSGGERFMVSLALALGLSSVQKVDTTPDTLFIDEGFGTLSSSCLREVMYTLSALRLSEGRRVGIISHVEALGERIPVHITVKRTDGTRAAVTVSDCALSGECPPG